MQKKIRRILLVEDQSDARALLAQILRLEGFEVEDVSSGDEAVEMFTRGQFDLVITDFKMPGKNGQETADALRAIDAGVRIWLLTGSGHAVQRSSSVERVIGKPVFSETLIRLINA